MFFTGTSNLRTSSSTRYSIWLTLLCHWIWLQTGLSSLVAMASRTILTRESQLNSSLSCPMGHLRPREWAPYEYQCFRFQWCLCHSCFRGGEAAAPWLLGLGWLTAYLLLLLLQSIPAGSDVSPVCHSLWLCSRAIFQVLPFSTFTKHLSKMCAYHLKLALA